MSASNLTPHQREVCQRLARLSGPQRRWVELQFIGSFGACTKLVTKGWAEHRIESGPRGGEVHSFRITERALPSWGGV